MAELPDQVTMHLIDATDSGKGWLKVALLQLDEEQLYALRDMMVVIGAMEAIDPGMRAKAAEFRSWFEMGLEAAEDRDDG